MRLPSFIAPAACAAVVLASGCAGYSWRSDVPEGMRSVCVSSFRNESTVTGLGSALTREVLHEFEREGTFKIAARDDAAVDIQGVVKSSSHDTVAYDRAVSRRMREYELEVSAEVSFIDRKSGKVLVDNRRYKARTTFMAGDDILTGERDASGRVAADLARQIVDDAVGASWK